jgi:serine/threonine protein kinase
MAKIFGDRWEIVDALKEGGQGHTFKVKDLRNPSDTVFALKRLKNASRANRFQREVDTTLKLDHRNIVKPVFHDLASEPPYFVTEYCEGGTLVDFLNAQWRSVGEKLDIFIKIADAVNHAHQQGVVHRDLKPENVFIRHPSNEPVVGDFGLCYIEDEGERFTETKEAVGARFYMAPELEDGAAEVITPSIDVYALGKILYWLMAGKIFSREKQREKQWNLATTVQHDFLKGYNPEAEHITRLVETMAIAEPSRRVSLSDAIISAKRIRHLVQIGVNPVSGIHLQTCTYCGWGRYVIVASGNGTPVHNFGFGNPPGANWRIYACNTCGHVQLFRLEMAKDTWWERQK